MLARFLTGFDFSAALGFGAIGLLLQLTPTMVAIILWTARPIQ